MADLALRKDALAEVDTANGDVIIIRNELGSVIGALSGQPRSGAERVLNAIRQYQCPEHPQRGCIGLGVAPDSVLIVAPASKLEALRAVLNG